jgi:flagellar basal body-associated protein FliL
MDNTGSEFSAANSGKSQGKSKALIVVLLLVIATVAAGVFYFYVFSGNSSNFQGKMSLQTIDDYVENSFNYGDGGILDYSANDILKALPQIFK